MKLLSRKLSLGMQGNDVALLHKGLIYLDCIIPADELKKNLFGEATREQIRKFQSEHNQEVTGEVDEATANLLKKIISRKKAVLKVKPEVAKDAIQYEARTTSQDLVASNIELEVQDPSIFITPFVLFGTLSDLSKLENDEAIKFVIKKLNAYLQTELLNAVGAGGISDSMAKVLQEATAQLDYQEHKDSEFGAVVKIILAEIKKNNQELADEVSGLESRLVGVSSLSRKVGDILHLEVPLRENSIFSADISRVRVFEYARVANLNEEIAKKLADKNLLFLDGSDEIILSNMVKEGTLTEKQKEDLQLVISLGKLTGDNVSFIKTLKTEELKSMSDLVRWEKNDWRKLINNEQIPLPPDETTEGYVENILFNIERTFPSRFLVNRLLLVENTTSTIQLTSKINLLNSLNILLENNDKLIEGENPATNIDWKGIGAETIEKLKKDLQDLVAFANSYRYLGIRELINNKQLDLSDKKAAISSHIQLLQTFFSNNPELDLLLVNLSDTKDESINWSGIPVADKPIVKKQLMAYQRMLTVSVDANDSTALLSKGYDSAAAISEKIEDEFVKTSGLELGNGRLTYARAKEYSVPVAHNFEMIRDVIKGQFKDIAMGNFSPKVINDLREIDGFEALFGPQNFCACQECMSILSPAAYFVDLMDFIELNVSKPYFSDKPDHPLLLRNRRGDLWNLELTCENTHTLIPYLTIVNEVLEQYLEEPGEDIYKKLSENTGSPDEKISFALPVNLPLEELRVYLNHFGGLSLHKIYKLLLKEQEQKIWRARINVSKEELQVITTPDPIDVKFRFEDPASFSDFDVQDFIRIVGITRQELEDLLATTFNTDLEAIDIDVLVELTPDGLENLLEILKNLTNERLDYIHRFVRLWRKTTWSIPELDLVLSSLLNSGLITSSSLDDTTVQCIGKLVDIQEMLKLNVEELCAMFHHIPTSETPPVKEADRRLFERMFDPIKLFGQDPVTGNPNSSTKFHHYSFNSNDPTDKQVHQILPMLLAGIGISETELLLLFDLLKNEIPFDADGECTLDLESISLLYRHARLARALKLSIEDFIVALNLNFAASGTVGNTVVRTLEQIYQLIEFKGWSRASPFNVPELRFILAGNETNTIKYTANLETVIAMVHEIQELQEVNKVDALKKYLSTTFNITDDQQEDILKWLNTDINSSDILDALNTGFTNGVPNTDLGVLIDLLREIERVMLIFSNLKFKKEIVADITAEPGILGIADINIKHLRLEDLKSLTVYKKRAICTGGTRGHTSVSWCRSALN